MQPLTVPPPTPPPHTSQTHTHHSSHRYSRHVPGLTWISRLLSTEMLVVTKGPTMVGVLMEMFTFWEKVTRSAGR